MEPLCLASLNGGRVRPFKKFFHVLT